jgi:signal transduction histidine kinase
MSNRSRFNILWIITGLTISVIAYLISFNYYHALELSQRSVLERLKAITLTASLQINGNIHQQLVKKWIKEVDSIEKSYEYQLLHQQLAEIHRASELEAPLYTIFYDSASERLEYGITSSSLNQFRQRIVYYPEVLLGKFELGGVLHSYPTEIGEVLSAFAPIKNEKSETVALLVADQSCSAFTTDAHTELTRQSVLAVATVLPFVLLLFFFTRKFLREQKKYEQNLQKHQTAIINQSKIIKQQNSNLLKKNLEIQSTNSSLDKLVKERTQSLLKTTDDLQTYLYRSSHDMRGPVSSILGLVRLMNIENKVEPFANLIHESAVLLTARIQSLSEVYEISNGKVNSVDWSLCELLEDVRNDLQAKGLNNYLLCQETDTCEHLKIDKDLAKILFKETISNSVYHNRLENSRTHIWVKTQKENGMLAIEIIDNGIGMEENVKTHAFQMFYRGHEKSQGIGLGLFKVKMIVEKLKGKLDIDSVKNFGTSIRVSLPYQI